MARLREINPSLDNKLKSLNDKIIAAYKVNGITSQTYKNIEGIMQNIAKATGAELKHKVVNGVEVPQVTRSASAYTNLPAFNQIGLDSAMAGAGTIKGIKSEMVSDLEVLKQAGRIDVIPKSFRGMKKAVGHVALIDKIRSQTEEGDFNVVQEFLDAVGANYDFKGALEGAFDEGNYDSSWIIDAEREVENALNEEREEIEALRSDIQHETDGEKIAQMQDELFRRKTRADRAAGALTEIKARNTERRARRK